ncbi:MAG: cytochrome c3 family protein [Magnetococcales bacterium]|nr:cytochrome c3 family protein [Magnetococcales bacterium]MBF0155591.1 cytochrome c3 family protein [Magnetococcales bacterium]
MILGFRDSLRDSDGIVADDGTLRGSRPSFSGGGSIRVVFTVGLTLMNGSRGRGSHGWGSALVLLLSVVMLPRLGLAIPEVGEGVGIAVPSGVAGPGSQSGPVEGEVLVGPGSQSGPVEAVAPLPGPETGEGALVPGDGSEGAGSNQGCLRCHGMRTLSYQDRLTGKLVSLFVDEAELVRSSHGGMACVRCHSRGFRQVPHTRTALAETLSCLDCHEKNNRFNRDWFQMIERQFTQSVHYQAHAGEFNCFSCHDPHRFLWSAKSRSVREVVAQDNAMCLSCHGPDGQLNQWSRRSFRTLDASHRWLPKAALHWRNVRCVECHTPGETIGVSHIILGAPSAERKCVACHSRDSLLLTKLYQHRVFEERQQAGFFNSVVLNDAYIIGMTRNRFLDWIGFLAVGGAVAGVSFHGLGRWLVARRKRHV